MSWSFSNAHRWQYSISNQEGRGVSLNLRLSDPTLGGRFRSTEVSWSWTEYFTPPWARLHALALITQGGFGIGDKRQFFGLGGYASQDVLRGVLLNQQQFAFLRGYPVNVVSGDSYLVASGEYRAPLLWIERGYQTFPLYLRRIWGTGFIDAGDAFQGPFHAGELRVDAGVEAHLEFTLFYYLNTQIQLGYARGFQSGGGNQLYFVTAVSRRRASGSGRRTDTERFGRREVACRGSLRSRRRSSQGRRHPLHATVDAVRPRECTRLPASRQVHELLLLPDASFDELERFLSARRALRSERLHSAGMPPNATATIPHRSRPSPAWLVARALGCKATRRRRDRDRRQRDRNWRQRDRDWRERHGWRRRGLAGTPPAARPGPAATRPGPAATRQAARARVEPLA